MSEVAQYRLKKGNEKRSIDLSNDMIKGKQNQGKEIHDFFLRFVSSLKSNKKLGIRRERDIEFLLPF